MCIATGAHPGAGTRTIGTSVPAGLAAAEHAVNEYTDTSDPCR
jgi:hypothetical protein